MVDANPAEVSIRAETSSPIGGVESWSKNLAAVVVAEEVLAEP
jgi:hypothetical protein